MQGPMRLSATTRIINESESHIRKAVGEKSIQRKKRPSARTIQEGPHAREVTPIARLHVAATTSEGKGP